MTTQPSEAVQVPELTLGWRMKMALSQAEIAVGDYAKLMEVSRRTATGWLNDEVKPRRAFLIQTAMITRVPLKWLETGEAPRPDDPDEGLAVRHVGLEPTTR